MHIGQMLLWVRCVSPTTHPTTFFLAHLASHLEDGWLENGYLFNRRKRGQLLSGPTGDSHEVHGLGGWCLISVGQAEAGTQLTTAPTAAPSCLCHKSLCQSTGACPQPLGGLPKGWLHSYGASLIWFSPALFRVWLAGARSLVDPTTATLEVCTLPWLLTLWAKGISSQANSLLLLHVSLVHLLPPLLGGSHGGDSQPEGSSAGHALVRLFHQALHWTGKTEVRWQGGQEAPSHRARLRLSPPCQLEGQTAAEMGRKWKI